MPILMSLLYQFFLNDQIAVIMPLSVWLTRFIGTFLLKLILNNIKTQTVRIKAVDLKFPRNVNTQN
jgi:hypothetical protein